MQVNSENQLKTKPYPKSVFFILTNEFCERFSYYGMKTVLALYLSSILQYSQDEATIVYHLFTTICYFFPLLGAIIADSFWGKFKELSLLGLLMISIGTGGIKPCVSSFGGDQFVLPEQSLQLRRFFSLFYFCINSGALISTFFMPLLRSNVKCFDQDTCFPLAFGTPSILMICAVVIFVSAKKLYVINKPKENVIVIFLKCIARALRNKFFHKNETTKKDHWLSYADDIYSRQQINDIRAVLNVLFLFIPVPLFWTLFDQQGSRWTFQATNMNGRIFGYNIKPDQIHVINPFLCLLFIPIFELYVYPILTRVGIKRPLQKLTLGGILVAFSFVMAAFLEFYVEKSYIILPSSQEGQMRLFNSLNCDIQLTPEIENVDRISALSAAQFLNIPVNESTTFTTSVSVAEPCKFQPITVDLTIYEKKMNSYFISETPEKKLFLFKPPKPDYFNKNADGMTKLRFFYDTTDSNSIRLKFSSRTDSNSEIFTIEGQTLSQFHLIHPDIYDIIVDGKILVKNLQINSAEIDTLLLHKSENTLEANIVELAPPNTIHMLWQLPQYIVITAAEIMFSVTGLEFSFTQAPESMKSVLSSAWLLTTALGNLIVVVVSKIKIFKSQAHEFLLFAGLMLLDMLLFVIFSWKYQYVNINENSTTFDNKGKNPTASRSISLSDLNEK